jgi:hypothetical protein
MVTLKIRSLTAQLLLRSLVLTVICPAVLISVLLSQLLPPQLALSADSNYSDIPVKTLAAWQSKNVPLNLDDVFIFPNKSTIKFDSALWKEHVGSRVYMLFDLYNQPLNEYSAEKVYDMLGQPDELIQASPSSASETATYDLGFSTAVEQCWMFIFAKGK